MNRCYAVQFCRASPFRLKAQVSVTRNRILYGAPLLIAALPFRATDRLALFGALLPVFDALHPLCDQWVIAAKTVSTMSNVSVPRLATDTDALSSQGARVAVVRRHRLAWRFVLVGGRR